MKTVDYKPKKKLFASGIAHEHSNPELIKNEKDAWKSYIDGKYNLNQNTFQQSTEF